VSPIFYILNRKEQRFMALNIVLVEPEIPQNTGNIGRTCVATGSVLHLVKPLGFEVTDKQLKRSGMDYWKDLEVYYYENLQEFLDIHKDKEMFFFSTKSKQNHTEVEYPDDAFLLFGKESKGLPEDLLLKNFDRCVRIPMLGNTRSLNLSNSVAVAVYEYYRQKDFKGLKEVSEYFNI
jgi:tRNA (cytidine/uridine-2'-O-)-methyltransferase